MIDWNLLFIIDIVFVALSLFFGVQAVMMFRKTSLNEVFKTIEQKEKWRKNLLYATVFLGFTMSAMSIVQVARYAMEMEVTNIYKIVSTLLYPSFVVITYVWYALLKMVKVESV